MARFARSSITAVLGPTNTGKTHLAVERMAAHSSGMMGFPLRLLAREVYDRLVAMKGAHQVALVTGEEKILPDQARWFCCTAESMPVQSGRPAAEGSVDRDFAFVALDEAQLGADPERGHVFTDRLLHARGREETMILGSAAITGLVRELVPEAEIIERPRFSTLSYAGAKKLSRLPPRSAVVAFSADQVYAVAEMLRRQRGGAAVVMGALSPRTRNAQVAMFQAGEVDYLVATDAVGMGLNMDVAHVAFAGLTKFDGWRTRRLSVAEMAQIAGRAGRHQRDGTFGTMGAEDGPVAFTPEEIERIEQHRFAPLKQLYWREGDPDFASVGALIASLEARPDRPELLAAPEAVDLAVLKRLAEDPDLAARARDPAMVRRLWAACGVPDFQKVGADHHARTVARLWRYLSEGEGHVPRDWFAGQIARLDTGEGDVETLAQRIAAARTWSYIAHRADWLAEPGEMAERTRALEEKLSDALHAALTQRFVDRRTAVLLRDIGRSADELPVEVADDGAVSVDGEPIGRLDGFRFTVDPQARAADRKRLLAAADRRLRKLLSIKADALLDGPDAALSLLAEPGGRPAIAWQGQAVAGLVSGPSLLSPEIRLDRSLSVLSPAMLRRVAERLNAWMLAQQHRHLAPLMRMSSSALDPAATPSVRALMAQLADAGGVADRNRLDPALEQLDKAERQALARGGIRVGALDIYHPLLLKPGATLWRAALAAVRRNDVMPALPPAGAAMIVPADAAGEKGARVAGFRGFAGQYLRLDLVERIARSAHDRLAKGAAMSAQDPAIVSLGLSEAAFAALMRAVGFRPLAPISEGAANWAFRGRRRRDPAETKRRETKAGEGQRGPRGDRRNEANAAPASGRSANETRPKTGSGGEKAAGPKRAGERRTAPAGHFADLARLLNMHG